MEVKLVVVGGRANQREIALKLPAVIGRSREANLTIGHSLVSRRHCLLHAVEGLVFVRDLNSTNGTFFEKRRIIEAPVLPDQHFSVGPLTFRLVYEFVGDASVVPPPQWAQKESAADQMEVQPSQAAGPWSSEPAALDSRVLQVPISTSEPNVPDSPAAASSSSEPAFEEMPPDQPDEPLAEEIDFEFVDDAAAGPPESGRTGSVSGPTSAPADPLPVWPPTLPHGAKPPLSVDSPAADELTLDDFLSDDEEPDQHGGKAPS